MAWNPESEIVLILGSPYMGANRMTIVVKLKLNGWQCDRRFKYLRIITSSIAIMATSISLETPLERLIPFVHVHEY